eukprot:gene9687-20139_t
MDSNNIVAILSIFIYGFLDSISIHKTLKFLVISKSIAGDFFKCFVANGILLLGSLLLFERIINPSVKFIQGKLIDDMESDVHSLTATKIVDHTIWAFYHSLWVVPVLMLCYFCSTVWYQEIADHTYNLNNPKQKKSTLGTGLIEIIYGTLVCYISKAIGFFLMSILYGWYGFDYEWSAECVEVDARYRIIESHWPYFFGFGFPSALLICNTGFFMGYGIFLALFPFTVILGSLSDYEQSYNNNDNNNDNKNKKKVKIPNLPIFLHPQKFSLMLTKVLYKRLQGKELSEIPVRGKKQV